MSAASFPVSTTAPKPVAGWGSYLIATLLACVASGAIVQVCRSILDIPLPPEFAAMSEGTGSSSTDEIHRLLLEHSRENLRQMLAILGAGIPAIFGLVIGLASRRPVRAILAAVVGGGIGGAAGCLLAPQINLFAHGLKTSTYDPLVRALMIHSASWSVVLIAVGLAVAIASGSMQWGVRSLIVLLVGGAFGIAVTVIGGAFLEQFNNIEDVLINSPKSLALWTLLPIGCGGFLLTWAAFRAPKTPDLPSEQAATA